MEGAGFQHPLQENATNNLASLTMVHEGSTTSPWHRVLVGDCPLAHEPWGTFKIHILVRWECGPTLAQSSSLGFTVLVFHGSVLI